VEIINLRVITLLIGAASGGEIPSCDFPAGARGDVFSSFLDVTVLLRLSRGSITSCHRCVLGGQPLPAPHGAGRWLQPEPGPRLPVGELGLSCPVMMAVTAPAQRRHAGQPAAATGTDTPGVPRAAVGERGKQGGARLLLGNQHPGASWDWPDFSRVLFWGKAGKKFNGTAASCVPFSYQVISIFNSETACISVFSLFITLRFVFCIVTVIFYINFA